MKHKKIYIIVCVSTILLVIILLTIKIIDLSNKNKEITKQLKTKDILKGNSTITEEIETTTKENITKEKTTNIQKTTISTTKNITTTTTTKILNPIVGKWYTTDNQCSIKNTYFDKEKNEFLTSPKICKDYTLSYEFKENGEFWFDGKYINSYNNGTIMYNDFNGQYGNNVEIKYYIEGDFLYINLFKMPERISETETKDIFIASLGTYPIKAQK